MLLLFAAAALLVSPAAGRPRGRTLALSPTSGQVGSSVTASGVGYPRNSTGNITFDGVQVGTYSAAGSAKWSTTFSVPAHAPGSAVVTAGPASAAFTVTTTSDTTQPSGAAVSATPPATPTGNETCGQQLGTSPPSTWSHVVWIVMENHDYSQIIGNSAAPYENRLASNCGLATNFTAESHPSLPNYIAMTSGSTQGITDDGNPPSHPLNVPSIFSEKPAGASRSLEESMPFNCYTSDSGTYLAHHNPMPYYTNLGTDCANYDIPLGAMPDVSAAFTFVTPNSCHNMHDCSISTGDSWLAAFIPNIVSTSDYQAGKTAIFLTFDENDGTDGNHVMTEVLSAHTAPGARSSTAYNHYNMLATTEDILGVARLGNALGAASMAQPFGLRG